MNILVTGGTGTVGKAVVRRLADHGHRVRVIGLGPALDLPPGVEYQVCDITDFPSLREAVREIEGVIHLAAVPSPSRVAAEQIFLTNAQGTFNLFTACEQEGIRRVVQASSINATGQFYGRQPAPLLYLPIDEAHPTCSSDVYSFSKNIVEEIGAYFWRRSGISGAALRLPYVASAAYHQEMPQCQESERKVYDQILRFSADERRVWFEHAWQVYNQLRAAGIYETPGAVRRWREENLEQFEWIYVPMSARVNFFTLLDERDSAQAFEKCLLGDYTGSHVLFVNDDHNRTGLPSRLLAELFYPDVIEFKHPLQGNESLVSIERARQLVGFEVEYSFA